MVETITRRSPEPPSVLKAVAFGLASPEVKREVGYAGGISVTDMSRLSDEYILYIAPWIAKYTPEELNLALDTVQANISIEGAKQPSFCHPDSGSLVVGSLSYAGRTGYNSEYVSEPQLQALLAEYNLAPPQRILMRSNVLLRLYPSVDLASLAFEQHRGVGSAWKDARGNVLSGELNLTQLKASR